MISLNMPKASVNDQVEAWLRQGGRVDKLKGFVDIVPKKESKPKKEKRNTRESTKLPPLDEAQANKLTAWLLVKDGRINKLANYLGVTTATVNLIKNRKVPCGRSRWINIVKFMECYKVDS